MGDRIKAIWGDSVMDTGFLMVPNALIASYAKLEISESELALILQVMSFKHSSEAPYPSSGTIAERMNKSRRHIFRLSDSLKEKGYLDRYEKNGIMVWDFNGLLSALCGDENVIGGGDENVIGVVTKMSPEENVFKKTNKKEGPPKSPPGS